MKFASTRTSANPGRVGRSAVAAKPDPDRCQFSTIDGRQCRMVRWEGHAPFCLFHARQAAREARKMAQFLAVEELGKELVSLSGEFKTATDINHFLGKLLLSIAQDRVPHRKAAAMAYVCQLLLQTRGWVKWEIESDQGPAAWAAVLYKALPDYSAGES